MSLKCYYHPDREATTKCEKCDKMICIECKKPISITHGVKESQYATQHEFCMPCYYDYEMKKYSYSPRGYYIAFSILLPIILTLVILGLVFISHIPAAGFGLLASSPIPTFLFVCLLVSYISAKKRSPGMLAELKIKKEDFFKTLQIGSVCPECGNSVKTGISICPSCGSDIAG